MPLHPRPRKAGHVKGNPRLDAVARGFVEQFDALDKAEKELELLSQLFFSLFG